MNKNSKYITNSLRKNVEKDDCLKINQKTERMDDYVIDYFAFNYIGKVIDNPELW